MKKSVIFLIHDLGNGGAEKVLVNLVNNMNRDKFIITVMVLFGGGVHEKDLDPAINLIRCYPKSIRGNSHIMKLFTPRQLYRHYIHQHYDIMVSFLEGPCSRVVSGCDDPSTKIVSWVHCTMRDTKSASSSYRSIREMKDCYNHMNAVVFVSKSVQEAFNKACTITPKQYVLYNTNESEKIIKLATDFAEISKMDHHDINWCGIGKLTWNKGFDRMIRIQKRLSDTGISSHLYILGSGEEEKSLKKLTNELGVADKVTFLGFQPNPYKYLSKCDLYVCASHSEGFSTAATEALIVGIPVCTVEVSGMKELLGNNNEWGVVVKNDDDCLYNAIYELMTDNNKLKRYRALAVARGREFSTEATVSAVEEMLQSL